MSLRACHYIIVICIIIVKTFTSVNRGYVFGRVGLPVCLFVCVCTQDYLQSTAMNGVHETFTQGVPLTKEQSTKLRG